MRVGIVAQRSNERAAALGTELREFALEVGTEVRIDEATAKTIDREVATAETFEECDLVVSIGGDGTFLYAARQADTTPILGVNLGEVGFLNAVAPGDAIDAVRREIDRFRETGEVRSRPVDRLQAGVATDAGEPTFDLGPALNEILVQGPRRGPGGAISLSVTVDGATYIDTTGDGTLVATPTGSTAYNLSEGGPLLRPGVEGLLVTGMCVDSPRPPVVVGRESTIDLQVDGADHAFVCVDGKTHRIPTPRTVTVERAPEPARVAGPQSEFFEALAKLE